MSELISALRERRVPIVLLSAGHGDFLVQLLKSRGVPPDAYMMVSNFYDHDESGKIIGFHHPLFAPANKDLKDGIIPKSIMDMLRTKTAAIVVGDVREGPTCNMFIFDFF